MGDWYQTSQAKLLSQPQSREYFEVIKRSQQALKEKGYVEVTDFLNQSQVQSLLNQVLPLQQDSFHNTLYGNAYLNQGDECYPKDHPLNLTEKTSLSVVAYDQIHSSSLLCKIYHDVRFQKFISDLIQKDPLYEYADPLGKINVSYMKDQDELRWHFDQSDFVVSLSLQLAESGGNFECFPFIKSSEQQNYSEVKKALKGELKPEVIPNEPGTLLIFQGKHTLHRVSQTLGATARVMALFAYCEEPAIKSSPYLQEIRYGRVVN